MRMLLIACGMLLAGAAHADRIILADGRVLEGKAEARDEVFLVTLRRGWVELPKALVARVEEAPLSWEVYAEKAAALAKEDVAGHLALAAWCREANLPEEARREWEAARAADPDCAEARRGLGHRQVDGKWLTEEEIRAARRAKKKEAGKATGKEGPEEVSARPVEGLFGPLPRYGISRPRGGVGGLYPVRPGSVWYFPWGTVYGPPLILCHPYGYGISGGVVSSSERVDLSLRIGR